jgi:hypothetical protein
VIISGDWIENRLTKYVIYSKNTDNPGVLIIISSILSPQPYQKCPLSNLSTQPCLFSNPNFAPKVPPRYVSMYVYRLFRLSRQLGCNPVNPVKSRLTAATSTLPSQHEVFRLFHTFQKCSKNAVFMVV